jgi:hypothetical protein
MGIGANQYNGMYGYNPFGQLLSRIKPAPEPVQPSMVAEMIARADAASKNVNVPTMEQLMPYLSSLYSAPQTQAPIAMNNSYGAGRFLSPAQGQQTGGVLGFNFNAPSMNKA